MRSHAHIAAPSNGVIVPLSCLQRDRCLVQGRFRDDQLVEVRPILGFGGIVICLGAGEVCLRGLERELQVGLGRIVIRLSARQVRLRGLERELQIRRIELHQ